MKTHPIPDVQWDRQVPLPPRTAFDVVLAAVDLERRGKKLLESFSFEFAGRKLEYWGRYYGYLFTPEGGEEFEFAGDSFREMLSIVVPQLGKAVWQMLDELPPDAVTVEFDPDWPIEPKGEETEG